MAGVVYSGKFEQTVNDLLNHNNVAATSKKFTQLETQHGPYSFGKFAKLLMLNSGQLTNWDQDAGGIPAPICYRLTEIFSTNSRSATLLPVVLKVGENVDATHGLIFKTFAHKGSIDSGIHMLCPNTSLN
jgi:hypothetical protein